MKPILFYLTFLAVLATYCGQTNSQTIASSHINDYALTGDTVTELSNNIMVVFQDAKNNYWFGSHKEGLYKYDGKHLIHFTTRHGLPSNRVDEIKEDQFGNLYFNTSGGLCQYNGNYFLKLIAVMNADSDWKLNPNDLWFKSSDYPGGVYRFDGKNLFGLKLPKTKLGEDYISKHPNNKYLYDVYCIYKDSKTNIWFGTAQLGVCRYNGKSFDWISETDVTELHNGPSNGVRSIVEDKQGDFWFNTDYRYSIYDNDPIAKKDVSAPKFYKRIKSIGALDGKMNGDLNEYLSIVKDNEKNLWIALYLNGVWHYDGKTIKHYPMQVNSRDIPIYCLYKDNKGDIWLGTHENGLFKFNGETFQKFVL